MICWTAAATIVIVVVVGVGVVAVFCLFFLRRCVFGNECLLHTNYTIISLPEIGLDFILLLYVSGAWLECKIDLWSVDL